ncbi:hypothetical protein C8R43DRAFT_954723 [Mycena crocata]|nr:hypothetical protein C8R43DRAFT_954723 [Mycena crocata]
MSQSESAPASPVLNPADAVTIEDHLKILRQSLKFQVPYTGGVHPIPARDLMVYYDVEGGGPRRIDLGNASPEDLKLLADTCQQATFGVAQEDILDESYRKAGKMDLDHFAARLDVVASGILDVISPDILQGQDQDADKVVRAEMYKLNVYGPGSFFKAHKDTPRGETMIGSLVVIFPTSHEGGELTLAHGESTWTFDSAAVAKFGATPAVAYVAFYSDVTHAVEPVRSGYRVTLTYNLFLVDRGASLSAPAPELAHQIVQGPQRTFEDALRTLLADPAFLPTGGLLAYGLAHQYPMPTPPPIEYVNYERVPPPKGRLQPVLRLLKGSDARIRTISQRAGLATQVKILYDSGSADWYGVLRGRDVVTDDVLNTEDLCVGDGDQYMLSNEIERGGVILQRGPARAEEVKEAAERNGMWPAHDHGNAEAVETREQRQREGVPVHWVTKITELNRVGSQYLAYGNEPSIEHVYGNAALFVEVPAFGEGVRAAGV